MALKSQACTLWGQVAESSRLCPLCRRLMGRAEARPAPSFFLLQVCREPHRQPGPQGNRLPSGAPSPRTAAYQRPGHRQTTGTAATKRPTPLTVHLACTQRAQALRLAQSARWLARERVRPGVTTALSLTLVAASLIGWQGPARGMRAGVPTSGTGRARRF